MMTLNQSSSAPSPVIPRWIITTILILSFIGFLDGAYLTVEHYLGIIPPCAIVSGCSDVLTSEYAAIAGVPVSLAGAIYYFFVFLLVMLFRNHGNRAFLNCAIILIGLGLIASLYFLFLQLFVIKALCLYCLISITGTIILAVLSAIIMSRPFKQSLTNKY